MATTNAEKDPNVLKENNSQDSGEKTQKLSESNDSPKAKIGADAELSAKDAILGKMDAENKLKKTDSEEQHEKEILNKALEIVKSDEKARVGSTSGGSKDNRKMKRSKGSYSSNRSGSYQNGESLDLDEYEGLELDEPFSDTDDEIGPVVPRRPHLNLPIPRRRIRTLSGTLPPSGYSPVWGGATMCIGCLEFFDLPKQTEKYMGHLLEHHRIVIRDIELIVDLKRYVEHWRHRFAKGKQQISDTFPKITPEKDDPLNGKVEYYYLMSEKVKEDRELRERLAMRRLEEVLYHQQREREDPFFNRQCLFCRYRAKGNRSKIIHHLYMIHHLNLGSPDNLVFVNEYLDTLKGKLDNNQCLYCEKVFSEHTLMMEHMRKRQHREVNPKNSYYDKFYVINYLELGKKWLDVLSE